MRLTEGGILCGCMYATGHLDDVSRKVFECFCVFEYVDGLCSSVCTFGHYTFVYGVIYIYFSMVRHEFCVYW